MRVKVGTLINQHKPLHNTESWEDVTIILFLILYYREKRESKDYSTSWIKDKRFMDFFI